MGDGAMEEWSGDLDGSSRQVVDEGGGVISEGIPQTQLQPNLLDR
jgi:hypothetical protein